MNSLRPATSRPIDPEQRNLAIDALRGVALCGIVLINIIDMGGPIAMDRPMTVPGSGDPDWQVWTISQLFITGTMRGLFSMLFGVGLLIFIDRGALSDRVPLYLRRLSWLFVFGLVDSIFLLWPGDILLVYALAGFVVLAVHRLGSSRLIAIAAVILLLISLWAAFEASALSYGDTIYSSESLLREAEARAGSYAENQAYMAFVSWAWTVNAFTIRWMGDAAAFMLVGIVLYRQRVFSRDADPRLIRRMMWIGYAVGLVLRTIHVASILENHGVPTILSAMLDQPGRLAMTLGHTGLFLLLWRRWNACRAFVPLARMGRMALTLYLGQSVVGALLFSGFGLGLWNELSWPQLWGVGVLIIVGQAILATIWFRVFPYGPVEWVWRWGTYGRRPGRA